VFASQDDDATTAGARRRDAVINQISDDADGPLAEKEGKSWLTIGATQPGAVSAGGTGPTDGAIDRGQRQGQPTARRRYGSSEIRQPGGYPPTDGATGRDRTGYHSRLLWADFVLLAAYVLGQAEAAPAAWVEAATAAWAEADKSRKTTATLATPDAPHLDAMSAEKDLIPVAVASAEYPFPNLEEITL
jgi:hypothetical protein